MRTTIRLQFVCGMDWTSRAIGWFSAGHLSHVDAVLDDGRLLGARSDTVESRMGLIPSGVRLRPANYEKFASRVIFEIECSGIQKAAYLTFLYRQLGRPYDKLGIAGFVAGRDWRDHRAWFCSELIARSLELASLVHPLYVPAFKVTPVACAMLVSSLGGRIIYATKGAGLPRH